MKNLVLPRITSMALVALLLLAACGKDGLADLFIPNISNQWKSSRDTYFSFTPAEENVHASTFTGSETADFVEEDELEGTFNNYDIEFTFTTGPENGVTYKGKFIKGSDPQQMQLKGSNGVSLMLTLQ